MTGWGERAFSGPGGGVSGRRGFALGPWRAPDATPLGRGGVREREIRARRRQGAVDQDQAGDAALHQRRRGAHKVGPGLPIVHPLRTDGPHTGARQPGNGEGVAVGQRLGDGRVGLRTAARSGSRPRRSRQPRTSGGGRVVRVGDGASAPLPFR
jgi:hypothetical protein